MILLLLVISCVIWSSSGTNGFPIIVTEENWESDNALLANLGKGCDFPVVNVLDQELLEQTYKQNIPFIIRNGTSYWAATINWRKGLFRKLYGDKTFRAGSEGSIVYSGGNGEVTTRVGDLISFPVNELGQRESFAFDTTILQAIPELWSDFEIPKLFRGWDSKERESHRYMWHFISLGPSRAGLPYHNHGKTWIGVVHGSKKWFMYPMGYGAPNVVDKLFDPAFTVMQWYETVYPRLLLYPKPPLLPPNISLVQEEEGMIHGHRPLECIQEAGDILFIPSMWSHLTINIGETIAIGGQESLSNEERLSMAQRGYAHNPHNYEATKDYGLALFNTVTSRLTQLKTQHRIQVEEVSEMVSTENVILQFPSKQALWEWMEETGDSVVVLYYVQATADGGMSTEDYVTLLNSWNYLAQLSKIDVDYATVSVSSLTQAIEDASQAHFLLTEANPFPYVIMCYTASAVNKKASPSQRKMYKPHSAILYSQGIHDVEALHQFLNTWQEQQDIATGSIASLPVRFREQLRNATVYLRQAVELKPFHPEALSILCEAYNLLDERHALYDVSHRVEEIYNTMVQSIDTHQRSISLQSLASLYHKLAVPFVAITAEYAARLLKKSTELCPSFAPAWRDYFWLMVRMGNRQEASYALMQLQGILGALSSQDLQEMNGVLHQQSS